MFRTNLPVTANAFHDREAEIERLEQAINDLSAGNPSWLALIGPRKIGKTSLLLELQRRRERDDLVFVVIDSFEGKPVSIGLFRRFALRVADAFFSRGLGLSLESMAKSPDAYRASLFGVPDLARVPQDVRLTLLSLADAPVDRAYVDAALRLPQQLAEAIDVRCVVAWDEFQELARVSTSRAAVDVLSLARAVWQRHDRVGYIVSGSERTMLRGMVASESSPFFQHFTIVDIGPMPEARAIELLRAGAPRGRSIPATLAKRTVSVLGGHPFYLQLFGDTLCAKEPPYDEAALKQTFSELLFSTTGRLALYFQREYDELVGRASTLVATLQSMSEGPCRLADIARTINAPAGAATRYIERLGDAVVKRDDGRYELADPVFALWLRWRAPGGTVVPMRVIGDEAELTVARALAQMGFELVYQSRASRGAFDIFAVRAGRQLGIQVKRTNLPIRFKKTEWNRMIDDADRLGWQFVVAAVTPDNRLFFLDPGEARHGRALTLGEPAAIDNLLAWMD